MFGSRLKIAHKLPLVVLCGALLMGVAIGGASYMIASRALEEQARQNLATVAFERANQLGTYLTAVQTDLVQLSKSETTLQALRALTVAFEQVGTDPAAGLRAAYIDGNPNAPEDRLLF